MGAPNGLAALETGQQTAGAANIHASSASSTNSAASSSLQALKYMVMAGTAEKMLGK